MEQGLFFDHISKFALLLEKASDEQEIFQNISEKIKEQYPDTYIIITVIAPLSNSYKIHVLKGVEKFRGAIEKLIGKDIFSIEFPLKEISKDNLRLNSNGQLNHIDGGIYSLALEHIPKPVTKGMEKLLGIDHVYTMGLVLDETNFGNLTIFCRKGVQFSTTDIRYIETLVVIATISLQKILAHHQIRLDAEKINRIYQVAPVGIGLLDERIFKDVNDRVSEITGYSKAELLNQSARILYASEDEFKHVGEVKYQQLAESGVGEIATEWICKDGSLKQILLRSSAINPNDYSEGMLFTALDISRRIEAERALLDSENRYRTLVENSPVAILIHRNGIIEYANKVAFNLLEAEKPEQIIGTKALDILHPDDRETALARIKTMYQTGVPAPVAEERFVSFTGREISLQVAANIIMYEGSPASLVFGIDVTELKNAENEIVRFSKELEENNQAKDKFFSIIAHDLKGPFNSILGFADILNTEYDEYSHEERKHFIRNISTSAQNTYRLLENLLEWSRTQTNRITFNPEVLELSTVINECILMVRSQAETKDIHLFSAVEFNTYVMADENMVKTIIRNLLSNAIKFSRRRGNVRVMDRRTVNPQNNQEMIEITVQDEGIGMSQLILNQLFKIDQMIKTPGTNNEKGTGLGLILCQELVNRNNGEIWAVSETGKGSTIHFTLPQP
ncbi:MAG: PAS domain-containing sensor histidine kinase [Bacteroidales bacterium]|nr:PAS domain-containing sensor histidine kinase [Bacteroidales bacterium]